MIIERMREIAREVGLDLDSAMAMDFRDFCRHVAMVRSVRESEKIALATIARRTVRP